MRISVFGLGYVGTVCVGCLSAGGHTVIGVDINKEKVGRVNDGGAPITEPEVDGLIEKGVRSGLLRATTSAAEAVAGTDLSLICVGTPSLANGNLDSSHVENVCDEIGAALAQKAGRHL